MSDRPAIPEAMKRDVRKRCGFGCVFCGLPIYEFEHIEPWVNVQEHRVENLVLLCPNHHAEFTRKQRSKDDIQQAAEKPFNLTAGSLHHIFHENKPPVEVLLGTNRFINVPRILIVDRIPIIGVENLVDDGSEVGVSAVIYSREKTEILRIGRNEWFASSTQWDIETVGPRLIIRSQTGSTLLQIRVDPPSQITFERGNLYFQGWELNFGEDYVNYQGQNRLTMRNCTFQNCAGGLALESRK